VTPRDAALAIWRDAQAAAAVGPLVSASLRRLGDRLSCGPLTLDLSEVARVVVLGCGKAGASMALAVESALGDRITEGFVVVKDGYTLPTRVVELAEAGHPVPDRRGQAAADRILSRARARAIWSSCSSPGVGRPCSRRRPRRSRLRRSRRSRGSCSGPARPSAS
jgi:hydroxypyruvate reductase